MVCAPPLYKLYARHPAGPNPRGLRRTVCAPSLRIAPALNRTRALTAKCSSALWPSIVRAVGISRCERAVATYFATGILTRQAALAAPSKVFPPGREIQRKPKGAPPYWLLGRSGGTPEGRALGLPPIKPRSSCRPPPPPPPPSELRLRRCSSIFCWIRIRSK
jgi:hypothetical protein